MIALKSQLGFAAHSVRALNHTTQNRLATHLQFPHLVHSKKNRPSGAILSFLATTKEDWRVFERLSENQSTFIPLGTTHRMQNPGHVALEMIEAQSGVLSG